VKIEGLLVWLLLGLGVLFCGTVALIELCLLIAGAGEGALGLFILSGAMTMGLSVVCILMKWRGKKHWEQTPVGFPHT
jgi:hypothetical protein